MVLATSRERLAVAGERVWSVPPLPTVATAGSPDAPPASVELFCDRARAVRPGVTLGGENLVHVAEICHHLDGLPLAIELAAARVRGMNVADLAQRLEARFRLLDGGSRTADRRHRSLRAVVDWSYELLDEGERRLFGRLSVFAGGFSLDAVEQVCAGAGVEQASVVELLGGLVDKSMVTIGATEDLARYGLLETLRHYGRELAVLLHRLNPVLRGWTNYFRHGVSKATFGYLGYFTWVRILRWLRHKHRRSSWKLLRQRYLPGGLPTEGTVTMFQPAEAAVTRYRYRGTQIATPWTSTTTASTA